MNTPAAPLNSPSESLVTTTHIVYALHTLGLVIGAFGTATVVGTFLFGWPSIIAVIINYVKRSEVRGTWLDSHFSWQIRTFWWALLWAVIDLDHRLLPARHLGHLPHRARLAAPERSPADASNALTLDRVTVRTRPRASLTRS